MGEQFIAINKIDLNTPDVPQRIHELQARVFVGRDATEGHVKHLVCASINYVCGSCPKNAGNINMDTSCDPELHPCIPVTNVSIASVEVDKLPVNIRIFSAPVSINVNGQLSEIPADRSTDGRDFNCGKDPEINSRIYSASVRVGRTIPIECPLIRSGGFKILRAEFSQSPHTVSVPPTIQSNSNHQGKDASV